MFTRPFYFSIFLLLICTARLVAMEQETAPAKKFSLVECAEYGWHNEVKERLVATSYQKETLSAALVNASLGGHASIVKLLLQSGADQNAKNSKGVRAVTFAVLLRHYNVVAQLMPDKIDWSVDEVVEKSTYGTNIWKWTSSGPSYPRKDSDYDRGLIYLTKKPNEWTDVLSPFLERLHYENLLKYPAK